MSSKDLDNPKLIQKYNQSQILDSIYDFPQQLLQVMTDFSKIETPQASPVIKRIVICGMGGSGLGGRMIKSLYALKLKATIELVHDYKMPDYVNYKTLVICTSYSGNTEESITNLNEAIDKKARIFVIASGGKLSEMAMKHQIPCYIFDATHNPSKMPRMGLGYTFWPLLLLFAKLKLIRHDEKNLFSAIKSAEKIVNQNKAEVRYSLNLAKQVADYIKNKSIILISAEHMLGAAHSIKNMLNENAKTFAAGFVLPELDHHLLEGLRFPKTNQKNLISLFVDSNHYSPETRKVFNATKDVFEKQKIKQVSWKSTASDPLSENVELLVFGAFLSFYLSVLNRVDPGPISWVSYFKSKVSV